MVLLAVFMSMGALVLGNLLLELRSVLSAGPVVVLFSGRWEFPKNGGT